MSGVLGKGGRKRGAPLTQEERNQRKKAARRVRAEAPNEAQRDEINAAKDLLRRNTPEAVNVVLKLMRSAPDAATRLRAAESILDRGHVPRRSEHDVTGLAVPLLVVDAGREGLGWPDADKPAE